MRICAKLALSGAKLAKVGTIWAKLSLSERGIGPNLVKLALSGLSYHYPRVELDQIGLSWHYRRVDLEFEHVDTIQGWTWACKVELMLSKGG